jgi:hypothetical protein
VSQRITLEPGRWYGWTMWPGYIDGPYHSPIRVDALQPCHLGNGRADLTFLNAAYAGGVQAMTYKLRILKREPAYLLASVEASDRAVCIEPLNLAWLEKNMRDAELPFALLRDCDVHESYDPIAAWLDRHYGDEGRDSAP